MTVTPDANGGGRDRPSNVLLLAPAIGADEDALCEELLHATGAALNHALVVTFLESSADRLAAWTGRGEEPERTTVIDVDAQSRSAAATEDTSGAGPTPLRDAAVERVSDPTDLIALGSAIDGHLDGHAHGATGLCFHSVTDALAATDRERVFKFLEVLTSTIDHADAVAHYHMNPDVHDPETIETLSVLFDAVVDLRDGRVAD